MAYRLIRLASRLLLLLVLLPLTAAAGESADGNWPSFRGPQARGVAEGHPTALEWNGESGENIRWKTPVPGLGHSSPVIWGDRVYVTTAIAADGEAELKVGLYGDGMPAKDTGVQTWRLYGIDRESGGVAWQHDVHEGAPKSKRHPKASHASSTPATDGHRLVVHLGSEGLFGYDMDGKLVWKQDLGVLHSSAYTFPLAEWGYSASPVIHDGKVVVQVDILKGSFLAVFDAADGSEVWRTARDEFPTWSTPTVYESGERTLILVNGYKHMGAYDFATGGELWKLAGGGDVPVPTPVVAHGLVYLTNAHGAQRPIYAIRPGAEGDISLEGDATANDGIAWSVPRGGTYMPTPIVYGDELYVLRNNGVLYAYDAKTGARHYEERMAKGTGFTSSPVAADGKLYFTSEMGETYVVKEGKEFETLAVNELGETVMATPAISRGTLFFRTRGHLVAIGGNGAGGR